VHGLAWHHAGGGQWVRSLTGSELPSLSLECISSLANAYCMPRGIKGKWKCIKKGEKICLWMGCRSCSMGSFHQGQSIVSNISTITQKSALTNETKVYTTLSAQELQVNPTGTLLLSVLNPTDSSPSRAVSATQE
jgi:hypothetical protein